MTRKRWFDEDEDDELQQGDLDEAMDYASDDFFDPGCDCDQEAGESCVTCWKPDDQEDDMTEDDDY